MLKFDVGNLGRIDRSRNTPNAAKFITTFGAHTVYIVSASRICDKCDFPMTIRPCRENEGVSLGWGSVCATGR